MRTSDPFAEVQVDSKRAVLFTIATLLGAVLVALLFPHQAALIAMILAFFTIIMLHELGHFLTAKRTGMKTTEFFVGFGPRLWSTKRGETEYGIKAIPLGGYCKIIGMTNLEEVAPEDEPRAYRAKPWGSKVGVAAAGPAVHFAIAIVLTFCVLFFAGDYRHQKVTTTLSATTAGSLQAGLRAGDEVIAINGVAVKDWSQVPKLVNPANAPAKAGDTVRIVVRRGDQVFEKAVIMQSTTDNGVTRVVAGVQPSVFTPRPGVLTAVSLAPREVGSMTWMSVKAIGSMFSPAGVSNYFRILSGDNGSGTKQDQRFVSPVGFGQLANDAVRAGWVNAFGLLIAINIFVGLFNLLPLLPFDGGHIAIASYERVMSSVRKRRVQVDVAKLMPITVGVVAVLGFIFLSSLFLDITRPVANPF